MFLFLKEVKACNVLTCPDNQQTKEYGLLKMKKVVVTGSASGIGFYTASKLSESGYDVTGIDLVKNLALGKSITQVECDLLDSKHAESVFCSIGDFDIAVNCAGVSGQRKGLTEFSKQEFEQSFSAVFFPTFNAM